MTRLLLAVLMTTALAAPDARAAEVRVAVGRVSGSISFMIESSLKTTLKKNNVDVVSSTEVAAAKAKAREDVTAWAPLLGVAAVIEADAARQGAGWLTTIRVVSGDSGKVLKTWKVKGKEIKKVTATIEKSFWKQLGGAISRATPVKKTGSIDEAEDAEEEADEEPKPKSKAKSPVGSGSDSSRSGGSGESSVGRSGSGGSGSGGSGSGGSGSGGSGSGGSGSGGSGGGSGSGASGLGGSGSDGSSGSSSGGATSAEVTAAPASPSRARNRNETPLEIGLGVDLFARSFRYNDDLFGQLRPYTLSGAPSLAGRVTWYPGAHFATGIAAHVGLELAIGYAFGVESSDASGAKYPTSAMELGGSLIGRLPIGASHEVTISAGGGLQSFSVSKGDAEADPDLPAVSYGFARAGAGARFQLLDELSVRLTAGYRLVTSAGDIQSDAWFPRSGAGGLDGSLAIGYAVIDSLEILLGVSGRHYFYTMNPEPGDPRIAGGAVDQYFGGTLSVAWGLR